jgi:hypothetical protein
MRGQLDSSCTSLPPCRTSTYGRCRSACGSPLWRLALGGDELVAFVRDLDAWLAGLTEATQ